MGFNSGFKGLTDSIVQGSPIGDGVGYLLG